MTQASTIDEQVIALLQVHAGDGVEISPDTNIIADTKMDSVAVMDFVMELEDHLDITIPLNRLADVVTVEDLLAAVRQLRGQQE
ncbi:MAG: acyl carrier protein [Pseudomonadota bacterium]